MKTNTNMKRRELTDLFIKIISSIAASIGIFFLLWIIFTVFQRGFAALSIDFFTKLPTPPGMEGGGLVNAITGTAIITFLATIIGVPVGVLTGIYLSEYGSHSRFGSLVRLVVNLTIGIPSIVVGLFVFALVVIPTGNFSAWAGALAQSIIMLPVIARTSEDMLNLVPNELREASLAIGMPKWRSIVSIIFRYSKSGIMTGVLLAVARISGETAPLLFTVMNSQFWMKSLNEPIANLTVTIYNYAMSPFDDWRQFAWGASLLITMVVLFLNIIARMILKEAK